MCSPGMGSLYGFGAAASRPSQSRSALFLDEYSDSESDATDHEQVSPSLNRAQTPPLNEPLISHPSVKEEPFRPELDVPKVRRCNSRFRSIRPIKTEETAETAQLPMTLNNISSTPQADGVGVRIRKRTRGIGGSAVSCSTILARRAISAPAKPLSNTKNAKDYRERQAVALQYKERLAEMLDDDIVEEVEEEGGITPLGRLFKAAVRMLERVREERTAQGQPNIDIQNNRSTKQEHEDSTLTMSKNEQFRQCAALLRQQTVKLNAAMREMQDLFDAE